MTKLQVVEWPNKVLETKAEVVSKFDTELQKFVQDMHETMDDAGGIGLAANQVNVLLRVITMLIPHMENPSEYSSDGERFDLGDAADNEKKWWHDKRFTFINPTIIKKEGKIRYMEGCLSFPEVFDYVERAAKVSVRAYDEHGKEFELEADGLFAICLQHEIDHIDGIVFINRMSRLKSQLIKKKIQKRQLIKAEAEA